MPRVNVQTKSARGAERHCGACGRKILPGEKYYQWSFRYGGTSFACRDHYPKRSQLTQSKMGVVYDAVEAAEAVLIGCDNIEDVNTAVQNVGSIAQEVADEYREAAEAFGGTGENADRADELEGWADELSSWEADMDDLDADDDLESARDQAQEILNGCPL